MGATKLMTAAGGGVILDAASTATDKTITIPARTGNMAVDGPAFSAASNSQTISTTTITKAVLVNEYFDTNNNFDNATNYRFQPTVPGYYQINITVQSAAAAVSGGVVLGLIYKNGAQYGVNMIEYLDSNATALGASAGALIQMNGSTDYVELYIFQSSGQNQSFSTSMQGFLARAL